MPTWKYYIAIARPDHWVKHIFILPGIVAALMLAPDRSLLATLTWNCLIGFLSAGLIASANYAINEWLDAETDKNHPEKRHRPAANGLLKARYVYLEYATLTIAGLTLAHLVNMLFFTGALAFVASGIIYNVRPIRIKDRVYGDVLCESINNPIRMILGWAMVSNHTIPPASLLIAYWAGGAFVMAAKRLSEYRFIVQESGIEAAGKYRRSFALYSTESLLISCFTYALTSIFGFAVFLIKYRTEYTIAFPIVILLFSYYLYLGLQPLSAAQKPELLHRDWQLMLILGALIVAMVALSFIDIPWIEQATNLHLINIRAH